MAIPDFGFVFGIILNVLGIVLLVGIGIGALFVWLSRRERRKAVERTWDHDYAESPPPPAPPERPESPAS